LVIIKLEINIWDFSMEKILQIKNLSGGYNKKIDIIRNVNFDLFEGEIVSITGHNGAGKSTLAKAIIGQLPEARGSIKFEDREIINFKTEKLNKLGIGLFMQGGEIFSNLTPKENLKFAGRTFDKDLYANRVEEVKKYFDFSDDFKYNETAANLSGGEKNQLALALILMQKPKLIILDEPSAGLSPKSRSRMFDIISNIKREEDIAILMIEQNIIEAYNISDRIMKLKKIEDGKDKSSIDKLEKTENISNIKEYFWN